MDNEADIWLYQYSVEHAAKHGFDLNVLGAAAYVWAERANCVMKSLDYEGVVMHSELGLCHTWSALIDRTPDRTLVYASGRPVHLH